MRHKVYCKLGQLGDSECQYIELCGFLGGIEKHMDGSYLVVTSFGRGAGTGLFFPRGGRPALVGLYTTAARVRYLCYCRFYPKLATSSSRTQQRRQKSPTNLDTNMYASGTRVIRCLFLVANPKCSVLQPFQAMTGFSMRFRTFVSYFCFIRLGCFLFESRRIMAR